MAFNDRTHVAVDYLYRRRERPTDPQSLSVWIEEQLDNIERAVQSLEDLPQVADTPPTAPKIGLQRYALAPWDPGQGSNRWYFWDGTNWVALPTNSGWAQFNNTAITSASPLAVAANTPTNLPLGDSGGVNRLSGDFASHDFVDGAGKFIPRASGDAYTLRLGFTLTPSVINSSITVELDIGGSQGVIYRDNRNIMIPVGQPGQLDFAVPIYALDTFLANGGQFRVETNMSCTIHDIYVVVIPNHQG